MSDPILSGALLGFALAFLVGPVFFMILGTSIQNGFLRAAALATGVMASDALYVLITGFGSSRLFESDVFIKYSGLAGGILLVSFGISTLFKRQRVNASLMGEHDKSRNSAHFLARGFILNTLNPFVLLFWLGVASSITLKQYTYMHTVVFYSTALVVVLFTDLLKAFVAHRLRRILTATFLVWLNRISGAALIFYGIRILAKATGLYN